jgi:hypothetical protein
MLVDGAVKEISKVICVSLLVLEASILQAAEDIVKKELSTKIVDLIDGYTLAQLQWRSTAVSVPVPVLPCHMLECTDTKVLLECMVARNMQPYFDYVKNQKVAKINAFVDSLLVENGAFLDASVNTGGGDWVPVDRTRDALKVALGEKVRGVAINIPAPAAGSIKSLYSYHTEVEQEIAQVVEEYINLFAPGGDASNFLAEGVNQPEYRSRGAFKNAILDYL